MNKLLIALTALLLSGTASAYWLQTIDYNSPNDSIEETPTQVDDDTQPYAPSDLPMAPQNSTPDAADQQPTYQDNTPPNPNTEESDGNYDDE